MPAPGRKEIPARVDLAYAIDRRLFLYGWVLDLTQALESLTIEIDECPIDLGGLASVVPRSDVAQHFGRDPADAGHGFYALIDLPEQADAAGDLRLRVVLRDGDVGETDWSILYARDLIAGSIQRNEPVFTLLFRMLPPHEARELSVFCDAAQHAKDPTRHNLASPPPGRDSMLATASPPASMQVTGTPAPGAASAGAPPTPAPDAKPPEETADTAPVPSSVSLQAAIVLDPGLLFLYGRIEDPDGEIENISISLPGWSADVLRGLVRLAGADSGVGNSRPSAQSFCFVAPVPPQSAHAGAFEMEFSAAGQSTYTPLSLVSTPQQALRQFGVLLGRVTPSVGLAVIREVRAALSQTTAPPDLLELLSWSERDALKDTPTTFHDPAGGVRFFVDGIVVAGSQGLYVTGWSYAPNDDLRVEFHCGPTSIVLSDRWMRCSRPDVVEHLIAQGHSPPNDQVGIFCFIPCPVGEAPAYLSIEAGGGPAKFVRLDANASRGGGIATVKAILSALPSEISNIRLAMDEHVGPAVEAAWRSRTPPSLTAQVERIGPIPTSPPEVTIIVPLFGRHELAEYQLALFADDPEIAAAELLYVVDDPSIDASFRRLAPDLFEIYRVPFTIASPGVNLGFSGANNFGARLASGGLLLLMNSDVMPKTPGWLSRLVAAYRALPSAGLLGPKLLYEDGSIQHAGMASKRLRQWGDLWINIHPGKGEPAGELRGLVEADLVTAACVMIDRELYAQVGGFSEDYIIGDFEDSDLCLRAREAGRRNAVTLDVELYHLERQSQNLIGGNQWRTNLTLYNCWLYNRNWGAVIDAMQS